MSIQEILNFTEHRPWKIPSKRWKFYQEWNNVIFLHWQVDISELQKLIPKEFEIELFNGNAWVSVVAFTMERIRLRNLPSFAPISNFDEINIRTYVKSNNKSGVYFLSIEGGTNISCMIAKGISQLPYRFSKIIRTKNKYESKNMIFHDRLNIEFIIGKKLSEKTELDKWLTERYALFQDTKNSINEFDIHHIEWPISEIEIKKLYLDYPRFNELLKKNPNKIHYSKGVKVLAWGKTNKIK